jgi:hypothetical protein
LNARRAARRAEGFFEWPPPARPRTLVGNRTRQRGRAFPPRFWVSRNVTYYARLRWLGVGPARPGRKPARAFGGASLPAGSASKGGARRSQGNSLQRTPHLAKPRRPRRFKTSAARVAPFHIKRDIAFLPPKWQRSCRRLQRMTVIRCHQGSLTTNKLGEKRGDHHGQLYLLSGGYSIAAAAAEFFPPDDRVQIGSLGGKK